MTEAPTGQRPAEIEPLGPARDFANFIALELEHRRSAQRDFDPKLFAEAVALVLAKLKG
jgi:hypothetical protein